MNIIQITDLKEVNTNGVANAVKKYVEYESKYENVCIYNLNSELVVDGICVFNYKDYKKIKNLPKPYNQPHLVVFNEVYKPKYLKLYKECIKSKIPYVIIPHGCLKICAQNKKRIKKKVCNFLAFNKFIKEANSIQFLNEQERQEARFQYKSSLISGNGIDLLNSFNVCKEKGDLIYIGRYDIKTKGLDLLVEVCGENKEWFLNNNIKINLYGISTGNELNVLKDYIKKYNVADIVIVNDAVYGMQKEEILKKAYAFIQLSRHEGQPMGILEASSMGVPCIVSEGTTFAEYMNKNKCGIGIKFDKSEVFEAIKTIYENKEKRLEYSRNSVQITNKQFNWDNIIIKLIDEYKNILKKETIY